MPVTRFMLPPMRGDERNVSSAAERIATYAARDRPEPGSCVELFRLVDWAQVCGINRGHSAGILSLSGNERLVTSIWLAAAIRVAAIVAVGLCVEERREVNERPRVDRTLL
jgi:hypothetical protein